MTDGKVHAKIELFGFNTEDVRLVISSSDQKHEVRMCAVDARFIVEAVAEANRAAYPANGAQAGLSDGDVTTMTRVIDCCEILDKRPRPMCRDCADECGICPHDGLDCDMGKLLTDARAILAAAKKGGTA